MNHWILVPVMLPAVVAALVLLGMRWSLRLGRAVSLGSCLTLLGVAVLLFVQADTGAVQPYVVGDWRAPFGIILVLDRLAALMLVLTAVLATVVMVHVIATDLDRRGWHFHPLFQFQLLGLNGAFLTGDIFNLFVFFEVLLIASYGLLLHGQGAERLKAGLQYVIVNLVGSTLFLFAIGLLYGVTGTLNMADLAVRIRDLPEADQGIAQAGGLLLLAVFGLKAALLPLHLWLPRAYAGTSPAVAALFAIMTKVGAYAIIRVFALVFGAEAGSMALLGQSWLLPAALLTTLVGFVGVVAGRTLREMAAFAVIGSTGILLTAVAGLGQPTLAAALYYLPHTTLAGATMFLVADLVIQRRGDWQDRLEPGPRFSGMGMIGAMFLLAAIAMAGLPPLSGFVGKVFILSSTAAGSSAAWICAVILGTTLLAVLGLARAGSLLFWKSVETDDLRLAARPARAAEFAAPAVLLVLLAALTVLALPATGFAAATAAQLSQPSVYVDAVLGPGGAR